MCDSEDVQTLQRGMNFNLNSDYSVILMSQRRNAPYTDCIHEDEITIEYEGHDVPMFDPTIDPKSIDQSLYTKSGSLTQNGKFVKAIDEYKSDLRVAELVRVYEKIIPGIWSERGFFKLIDYIKKDSNGRMVFRFILKESEVEELENNSSTRRMRPRSRIIPTVVKKEVWERDGGQCVMCGRTDELHFDHDLPFSKGGTSITAENVRILCARHNLEKSDKIQ